MWRDGVSFNQSYGMEIPECVRNLLPRRVTTESPMKEFNLRKVALGELPRNDVHPVVGPIYALLAIGVDMHPFDRVWAPPPCAAYYEPVKLAP